MSSSGIPVGGVRLTERWFATLQMSSRPGPMPVKWREDLHHRWIVVVVSDPYNTTEWATAMKEVLAHRDAHPPLRLLIDARYCSAPLTPFVRRAVEQWAIEEKQLRRARIAIVVGDDASYGMARMAEIAVDVRHLPFTLRGFRDWDHAGQWLAEMSEAQGSL